jgi:hypothetical protein
VTNDEFCLAECAKLRAELGLPRVTSAQLGGYLDKVVMKTRLAAAGIPVPRWAAVDHVGAAERFPSGLALPVVAKPRIGSNSRGVRVIRDDRGWRSWVADRTGQQGWEIEEFVPGRMCFVDGLVVEGDYEPVLVGCYLGGLLLEPGVDVLGAISVPRHNALWQAAVGLGCRVARTLGDDGRFATHLEFFEHGGDLVVMEVCVRAPGALVSEMARATSGHNLETVHLRVQAGLPAPAFTPTGWEAAWVSVLARPGQSYKGAPDTDSSLIAHRMPTPPGAAGRHVAAMALLVNNDLQRLEQDVSLCTEHVWFT